METIPEFRNTFETFRNWRFYFLLFLFLVISNIIGRWGGRFRFSKRKKRIVKKYFKHFFFKISIQFNYHKKWRGGNGREIWKKEIDNNKLEGLGEWMNGEQDFFFFNSRI